jgi:signal transduction histidine kinase
MLLDGDKGEITPQVKDLLQKIMVSGNDVITLLSQYLDKSKIELGQIEYIKTKFDVVQLINEILATFQIHAEQKGIELTERLSNKTALNLYADQAKVKEVITNILDNAIKYTPEGSIVVSVKKDEGSVLIKIADTGVGIKKDVMPFLFKEFSRADLHKVNILGTGLGLYLAKKFTEGHKGAIWAESGGEGKGSQFYIQLPLLKNS